MFTRIISSSIAFTRLVVSSVCFVIISIGDVNLVKLVGVTNVFGMGAGVVLVVAFPIIRGTTLRFVFPVGMGVFGGVGRMIGCGVVVLAH